MLRSQLDLWNLNNAWKNPRFLPNFVCQSVQRCIQELQSDPVKTLWFCTSRQLQRFEHGACTEKDEKHCLLCRPRCDTWCDMQTDNVYNNLTEVEILGFASYCAKPVLFLHDCGRECSQHVCVVLFARTFEPPLKC